PEPREEVDAREPGPLAVRLEQRRRLLGLDPTLFERTEQLDQPQVADEPALGPPEALEADDAHRPRPEPALTPEPGRHRVHRHAERPQPLEPPGRLAQQTIAATQTQEGRVVVVEPQHEPHPLDALLALRGDLDRAVGALPSQCPLGDERLEHAVAPPPRRVA